MILKITKNTDPVWKKKFSDISVSPQLTKIVADMQETLEFTMGVGLAAPQVGYPWRMFIVDYADLRETFINPHLTKKGEETDFFEEGCLSIPGCRGLVERAKEIELDYTNLKGERKHAQLSGFYARIIQHEYDHLNSTFYINHIKKDKYIYRFKPVRIVFLGSSNLSAIILKSLIGQTTIGDYEIPLVITTPDQPSGRGQKLQSSPVKVRAQEFAIPTITPERLAKKEGDIFKLTNSEVYEKIKATKPDMLVLAAYGKILPQEILDLPKYAPLNVHPSLLPKYRGPAPIQAPILNGDKYSGVTIMKMNSKMDEGDIYLKARYKLADKETAESLTANLAILSKELLHHVIHYIILGKIKSRPQDHTKASYTKIITRANGKIDWQNPPKHLDRFVRAYYPWPGVWTAYNGKLLKLLPGKNVQLEGKTPIKLNDFKAGHKDFDLDW